MPVYRNDTLSNITPAGGRTYEPGDQRTELEYLRDPKGLTLVRHADAGFAGDRLYAGGANSGPIAVYMYNLITIYNASDADLTITPNDDTDNARVIPAASYFTIINVNLKRWHTLATTGTGTGVVRIWGDADLENFTRVV